MFYIRVALVQDIPLLTSMAHTVWTEYYTELLGNRQVEYMLEKFQSPAALRYAMTQEGMVYYLLYSGNTPAGYCGWRIEGTDLFISKLYILKPFRHKGAARQVLERLKLCAPENGANRITLTVNKHNAPSVAAYNALGFQQVAEQVVDIGGGFVMDDWVLACPL